ncbi:MAG: acyloxyacyl hydrolase [Verrucomicrobiales bacterium]|jgi:opacity protein-like surface antigen|nr:acyloxyacyl hydrolase [Verrucomicrobiales bacterium]
MKDQIKNLIKTLVALPVLSLTVQDTVSGGAAPQTGSNYQGAALYEIFPDGNIVPAPNNPRHADYQRQQIAFRAAAETRKDAYLSLGYGVNAAQQGDWSCEGEGNRAEGGLKSSVGYAANFRGGYTWQLGDADAKDNLLALSLEGEMLYTWNPGVKIKGAFADGAPTESGKFDLHIWALMVNPILRFQLGKFVPYVGVGIGGALVLAANPVDGSMGRLIWSDSRYGAAFAFQGMTGFDYYFNDSWSIFTEYKYLGLAGLNFNQYVNGNKTDDDLKTKDILGNHLLMVGVRWHF